MISLHNIDYITPIQGYALDVSVYVHKYAGMAQVYAGMMTAGATGRKARRWAGVGGMPRIGVPRSEVIV